MSNENADSGMMEHDEDTPSSGENLYKLVFENAPVGIFLYDEKGMIRECNDFFVGTIGSSREALVGLDMPKRIENESVLRVIKETLEGRAGHYEGPYVSVTAGKESYIRLFCKPLLNEKGGVAGGIGIVDDLTELMQAEQSLKESEEKYRLVVDNANEAIIVAQDYKIVFMNPKSVSMTGYAEDEVVGENFSRLIFPEDLSMVAERHKRRLEGEELGNVYPFRIIRKDGEVRWVEINAVAINWNGKPATLNFLSDITERKKVEGMIISSEEKFRGLFESSLDGIAYCDMEGKIVDVNRSMLDMLRFTKDELAGRPLSDITPEKYHGKDEDLRATKLMILGDTGHYEKEFLKKDGSTTPVQVRSWLARDEHDEPCGIWVVARGIEGELKVKEEIRRRMLEIEKLNKFMIGREVRIIEMKKEVNELLRQVGQQVRYKV